MTSLAQLGRYRKLIDEDIAAYAAHVRRVTAEQYGSDAAMVTNSYLDLLQAPGKRLRGTLVIVGYEMLGGADPRMIVRAATAIEMIHTYLLIIDDIQDRSPTRRGLPAAHEALASRTHGPHTGMSLALNAALAGSHAAQMLLAGLDVDPQLKVNVLGIVNHTMIVTAHGQTYDILGSSAPAQTLQAKEWKTAHYSFLNPLCVGMVLAEAGCEDTNAIREYALNAGIAFQLADDMADSDSAVTQNQIEMYVRRAREALRAADRPWDKQRIDLLDALVSKIVGLDSMPG